MEYVSLTLRGAKEAAVLLYAPGADSYFKEMEKNADRIFYFGEGPRTESRIAANASQRTRKSWITLEAFT